MAEIEIGPLSNRLSDEEIIELGARLKKLGAGTIPDGDDSDVPDAEVVQDHVVREFMDHLDGHDLAAEVFIPVEFDGTLEVAGFRFASLNVLIDALEELGEELDLAAEEDDDDDEDDDDIDDDNDLKTSQTREVWKIFSASAAEALEKSLPLHVKTP